MVLFQPIPFTNVVRLYLSVQSLVSKCRGGTERRFIAGTAVLLCLAQLHGASPRQFTIASKLLQPLAELILKPTLLSLGFVSNLVVSGKLYFGCYGFISTYPFY